MTELRPFEHTGDSANIAYYTERGSDGRSWAEVLRNDLSGSGGVLTRRRLPVFRVTVWRTGTGPVASFTYAPKTKPAPGPLPGRTVTRLIRAELEARDARS